MNIKQNNIILIISIIIVVTGYHIYTEADYKKNQERLILERDSIKTLEFNNKIKKLDSICKKLEIQDSILTKETNVLKKKYKERKKDIDINRNTLPTLPNF